MKTVYRYDGLLVYRFIGLAVHVMPETQYPIHQHTVATFNIIPYPNFKTPFIFAAVRIGLQTQHPGTFEEKRRHAYIATRSNPLY